MKTALTVLILVALVAIAAMSLAPAELVGVRTGLGSVAGVVTAVALLVIAVAGGWIWLQDRRNKR